MATSTVTGTGAFDVNAIVSGLMKIERQPIDKLNTKETSYQSKITALGLIQSKMSSFQTALQNLTSTSSGSFSAFSATSSDISVFTASAASTAVAGTYSLEVSSLAQSQKLAAAGQVSQTTAIGNGTLSFDFGTITGGTWDPLTSKYDPVATSFDLNGSGTKTVTIDATNNTLQGIRDAINTAGIGVTASIVNDGGASPYRLALSSNSMGVSNSIKISVAGDAALGDLLNHDPTTATQNLTQTAAAQNANFKVNGIPITKTSNSVTDAIEGVTLTLNKVTTAPVSLAVARDTAAVSTKISAFVTAYNDLYSSMKNSSAYKSKSALEGDSTLRNLQMQMRSIASGAVSGGTMSQLFQVGITFSATGTMQLDSAKLDSAMGTDFNDVANLFNSTSGYATLFSSFASNALALDGTFASKTNGLNQSIKDLGLRRDALELRMTNLQKQYTTTYSNLNVLIDQMSRTSAYLTNQLG